MDEKYRDLLVVKYEVDGPKTREEAERLVSVLTDEIVKWAQIEMAKRGASPSLMAAALAGSADVLAQAAVDLQEISVEQARVLFQQLADMERVPSAGSN